MARRTAKRQDVLESIDRMIGRDVRLRALIDEEMLNAEVAAMLYRARTAAGLTQRQLAKLVGTTQPTIARLEDADYPGHSLSMLRRIASALNKRLELRLVPKRAA
jgi:DNA-binding XRE family transcriptional regulator